MLTKLWTGGNVGIRSMGVEIEVNVAEKGFPSFGIVGMSHKCAEEVRERVKTAIINSEYEFPNAKITVNLAPADLRKDSSCFDLPIALGLLCSTGQIKITPKVFFYGELALDGSLRHTKGVFNVALLAKELGICEGYVPRICANEAAVISGVTIYPADCLRSVVDSLSQKKPIMALKNVCFAKLLEEAQTDIDVAEIVGQAQAKRALEIAAAGGHNLYLFGPPGSGKTMLARALPGIMPKLTEGESLEVTEIYSVTGNIPAGESIVRKRPFRAPHHSVSLVGLTGGGSNPKPGEVSLAHRGVLFLDEFGYSSEANTLNL